MHSTISAWTQQRPSRLLELRRLVDVSRAYTHRRRALMALARNDLLAMSTEYQAAAWLIGSNPEMRFFHAIALLAAGRIDDGIGILREVVARDRNWQELALRLPESMLPHDPALLERIRKLRRSPALAGCGKEDYLRTWTDVALSAPLRIKDGGVSFPGNFSLLLQDGETREKLSCGIPFVRSLLALN